MCLLSFRENDIIYVKIRATLVFAPFLIGHPPMARGVPLYRWQVFEYDEGIFPGIPAAYPSAAGVS